MPSPLKKSFAAEQLRQRKKKPATVAIAVVAVIIAIIAVGYALYIRPSTKEIPTETVAPAPEEKPITSLAVLPLDNMIGDSEQEFFCEGMHEALITSLSKIGALRVIARTSVMGYKGTDKKVPEIAKELNVDAVVEGSVFRSENTVRITVQLVRAEPEKHLFANDYVRELQDVIMLQQEVARAIAAEIEVTVTSEEKERLSSTRKVNPEAYELYMMGLHFGRTSAGTYNREKSLDYYKKAIEKDSTFAKPYAEIAYLMSSKGVGTGNILEPNISYIEARKSLERAFEIDDTTPNAYLAQATINMFYEWDWNSAEINLKKSIDLDPSYMTIYLYIDDLLTILGREKEALEFLRKAMEIDPLSKNVLGSIISTLGDMEHYEEAEQIYQKGIDLYPTWEDFYFRIGFIYAAQGKYEEAIAAFTKRAELSGTSGPNAYIGYVYGLMGKREEAEKILLEFPDVGWGRFHLLLGLKDFDPLFEEFYNAYKERSPNMSHIILYCKRRGNDIVKDPRWNELMRKLGLPES
ncbi:tetratricopeptide repeat protein [Candidatus Latescibacterota bacterium]